MEKSKKLQKPSKKNVQIEPDYFKDDDKKSVKENLGNKLTMDPKKKSMTPETVNHDSDDVNPDNSYYIHILFTKGKNPGEQDHKTEIVKMKHDPKEGHPKDQAMHDFVLKHPITKIHQKNGYDYHFAIGSTSDDPTRMNELMQFAQKSNKGNQHKAKIWEDLVSEVTDEAINTLHERHSK
jgi:hypothetical protein